MKFVLRLEPYDPDAFDGDGDGIVQEGTAWERPAGSRLLNELGQEIQRGITSSSRPSLRIVDANGTDISYKPSYGTGLTTGAKKPKSTLGRIGYPSLEELGIRQLSEQVETIEEIITNPMRSPQVRLGERISLILNTSIGRDRTEAIEIKAKADSLLEALNETGANKQILASLLLGGAYWATTLFGKGDVAAEVNNLAGGALDADGAERLSMLADVFVVGGMSSLNHAILSLQERWDIAKEQASQLRDAMVARFEQMKLKAGELSDRMKQQLSQLSASLRETLRNIRKTSLADRLVNIVDGPEPIGDSFSGVMAQRLTPDNLVPDTQTPDVIPLDSALDAGTTPSGKTPKPKKDKDKLNRIINARKNALPFVRKFGDGKRARRRAEDDAKNAAWNSGTHYLVETDDKIHVLSEGEYNDLLNELEALGIDSTDLNVTAFFKPKPDVENLEEVRNNLQGVKTLPIDDAKYRDGVVAVHYASGSVEDIDDEAFAAVVFDEGLVGSDGGPIVLDDGTELTFEQIMSGQAFFADDDEFSNARFNFKVLKGDNGNAYGGLWSVYKVTDKETGEVWYVKSSTYGSGDGMLESVGMELASVLGMASNGGRNDIRISPALQVARPDDIYQNDSGEQLNRTARWTSMKSIELWETNVALRQQQDRNKEVVTWLDANDVAGGLDEGGVDVRDMAKVLAFDYIFDNTDRHGGNFKVAYEEPGIQRLGLIDMGLLFGGRIRDHALDGQIQSDIHHETDGTEDDFTELGDFRAGMSPYDYSQSNGNILVASIATFGERLRDDDDELERFQEEMLATVDRLEAEVERILSPERFDAMGVPLTPVEKAHLIAMRHVAMTRIQYLKDNPMSMIEALDNAYYT